MKKVYEKPMISVENFVANEFCSTCKPGELVYKFVCDAPNDGHEVYQFSHQDGTIDGVINNLNLRAEYITKTYEPCGSTHTVTGNKDFSEGFIDYNKNGNYDKGEEVILWRPDRWEEGTGWFGKNTHATKSFQESMVGEVAKS